MRTGYASPTDRFPERAAAALAVLVERAESVRALRAGLNVVEDANGFAYITSNFQHPGEDRGSILEAERHAVSPPVLRTLA